MYFSELEKEIILGIIKLDNERKLNVLDNVLESKLLYETGFYFEIASETECTLKIEENYFHKLTEERGQYGIKYLIEGLTHNFIIIVKLMQKLEIEEYIHMTGEMKNNILGVKIEGARYIDYKDLDYEIKSLLFKYSSKKITPTNKLHVLVKNNFRTEQEIYNETQIDLSRRQFKTSNRNFTLAILALAIALASTLFAIIGTSKIRITNETLNTKPNIISLEKKIDQILGDIDNRENGIIELIHRMIELENRLEN